VRKWPDVGRNDISEPGIVSAMAELQPFFGGRQQSTRVWWSLPSLCVLASRLFKIWRVKAYSSLFKAIQGYSSQKK
jgi:hypothetical protein